VSDCYCDNRRVDGTCKDCGCKVITIQVESIESIFNIMDAALGKQQPPPFTVDPAVLARLKGDKEQP
jgi:hypothetical protein